LLYTADVLLIAARHGVGAHSYADDTQLYLNTTADNCEAVCPRLFSCIEDIGLWMSSGVKLGRSLPEPRSYTYDLSPATCTIGAPLHPNRAPVPSLVGFLIADAIID